ncbi:MAG: ATPase [Cellulosilyticaceae bacterium]
MNSAGNIKHVFPGSNTPQGFVSFFSYILSQNEANKIYSIKGGPGTGKSSFMKRVGNYLVDQGIDVEFFHCSSDPNSLDGICIPSLKIAMVDGTAPHVIDPIHPGAVDVILNFGCLWDEAKVKNYRESIIESTTKIGRTFKKAYFYLASAKNIYDGYLFTEETAIDELAKVNLENAILTDIFKNIKPTGTLGSDRHLFSSAITPEGFVDYLTSIIGKTKNTYFFKETLGCNSKNLMNQIRDKATSLGYKIECYHSPIDTSKIEDLIIPELDIAITTSNPFHKAKIFPTHIYDFTNCLISSLLKDIQPDLDKDKKLMTELFNKGINTISLSHKMHDILEAYYISAIDFSEVEPIFNNVIEEILSFKK